MLNYLDEHVAFRDMAAKFVEREVVPFHAQWEAEGAVSRNLWRRAGELGALVPMASEEYGGLGADFLYSVIMTEELCRVGATGPLFYLHSEIVAPYIEAYGSQAQKSQWLPRMISGQTVAGIAMTEPSGGSDLAQLRTRAVRTGDGWELSGGKIFISNGQIADLFVVAARTGEATGSKGVSLFLVESVRQGFSRGRNLHKLGMHAQDTSELFFENIKLPADALLGEAGSGFTYMMAQLPQERLMVAIQAVACMESAFEWTREYVQQRNAFGGVLSDLQHVRFEMAEIKTDITVARSFLDECINLHLTRSLSAERAAMAKYWLTDSQFRVMDRCLQLFGGYGYMTEYPIGRAWADSRVQRIYGGANEIMKEIISRGIFGKSAPSR